MTRILFATDLHGNAPSYTRLWALAAEEAVDAVVLGGDLLPLPLGQKVGAITIQRDFAHGPLADGLRGLHAALPGVRVFGLLGNDDWVCCLPQMDALVEEGLLLLLHEQAHRLDEARWIAGYSCVPVTPFKMSDWDRYDTVGWSPSKPPHEVYMSDGGDLREGSLLEIQLRGTIEDDLRGLAQVSPPQETVYVTHSPPHGTNCDQMHGKRSIGSLALRAFIQEHQPPLTLHGHVHESPRMSGSITDQLGATVCVNPGDSRSRLRAVVIDLDDLPGSIRQSG